MIIQHGHKEFEFFERIERIVIGNRQKIWIATHLPYLVEPLRAEEDWDNVISILKKILHYEPNSSRARSDLVRAYRAKYETHSLLAEFLKLSDLTNHKRSVEPCIISFERNIVFDVDNYVYHRKRGVGKIKEIDSVQVIIDFAGHPGQCMSIQMAIHSLQPLQNDHIWAKHYENPKEIEYIFENDLELFLEALLTSFGKRMTMSEIKSELLERLLTIDKWSKWWAQTRSHIKKSPRFGFNPQKKDEVLLRDKPLSLTDELSGLFQSENDWHKKIELAFHTLKNDATEDAALIAVQLYKENSSNNKEKLKRLHSYLFLKHAAIKQIDVGVEGTQYEEFAEEEVIALIKSSSIEQLAKWSLNTKVIELKKDLVDLVVAHHSNYIDILRIFLFQVPIKVHRYIFSELIRLEQSAVLRDYLQELCRKYRDHSELFLWAARSILTKQWDEYDWVNVPHSELLLLVFRLLKPLALSEKKGSRLKNTAVDIICGNTNITVESLRNYTILNDILKEANVEFLQRAYVIFRDVPYIADAHKENMLVFLRELQPGLSILEDDDGDGSSKKQEDSLFPPSSVILSSPNALDKRREYLDHLIHVEMPANSRDIGEAQEKGDLRENAEYKASMERQSQLQAEISSISRELQKVRPIRSSEVHTDFVSIGSCVKVNSKPDGDEIFTILGPWDVDSHKNIISYESPLAQVLVGKKIGEKASLDSKKEYTIR